MTVVLIAVIVVLLVLLGGGFVVAARRVPLGRARRDALPPAGAPEETEEKRTPPSQRVGSGTRPRSAPRPTAPGSPARRPGAPPAPAPPRGAPPPPASGSPAPGSAPPAAASPEAPARADAAALPDVAAPPEAAPEPELEPADNLRAELEAIAEAESLEAGEAESLEAGEARTELEAIAEPEPERAAPPSFRERLSRTRQALASSFGGLRGRRRLDERTLEDLEEALILADVGLPTTMRLLDDLRERLRSGEAEDLATELKAVIADVFDGDDLSLHLDDGATSVWLFVGVNGAGKTTTIGKLAAREVAAGRHVVLGAGDTFRAAAGDQLELWARRSGASIVRGAEGADPSSVIFDAVQHAAARDAELVLADSAGRLHTKVNLMEELRKVRRIADRPPGKVTEVLLVLDATTGQNGLVQARQFAEAVGVTGVVLTKLDGTAKGGIAIAIRSELDLPIKLVGLGEGPSDLVEFDPDEFADALFG